MSEAEVQLNTSYHFELKRMSYEVWDGNSNLWKSIRELRIGQQKEQQEGKESTTFQVCM